MSNKLLGAHKLLAIQRTWFKALHFKPEEQDLSLYTDWLILSQCQGPKAILHPVAFFSQSWAKLERIVVWVTSNYWQSSQHLKGVISIGKPVLLFTKHKNLQYLRTAKCLTPLWARWDLFYFFLFPIIYCPRSKNGRVNALSCMFAESSFSDTILSSHNFLLIQPYLMSSIQQASALYPESVNNTCKKKEGAWWYNSRIFVP